LARKKIVMHMRRIAISTAITAFWLVMMGLLIRNHVLSRRGSSDAVEVSPDYLTEEWRDYEEWMELRIAGKSDGVSYTSIRRRPERSGYVACNRIWLDLDVLGGRHTFRLNTAALLDTLFRLERATADVRLDDSQMSFVALSKGTHLYYRWEFEGQTKVGSQKLDKPISLLEAVRPLVARRFELKVGNAYRLPVLDSTWSLREGVAEVRVEAFEPIAIGGKSVEAYRLVTQLGPFSSTTWVNAQGEVLRREFAGSIAMERVEPEKARARFAGIDAPADIPQIEVKDFIDAEGEAAPPDENVAPVNRLLELFRQPADK
jgi:hypothetical protein